MPFTFSAFISYSSKDRAWAERLRTDLNQQLGRPVYLDVDRLEEGKEWNKQLTANLADSEHLVVLYTGNAASSDWVKHEMSVFNALAGEEFSKARRLLCVQTDAAISPTVYTQIQHVRNLVGRNIYGGVKPEELVGESLGTWNELIARIRERLLSNAQLLPLALVVMTEAEADDLQWNKSDPGSRLKSTLGAEAATLGIADLPTLKSHYGHGRGDWKPFGSALAVNAILGAVLGSLNQAVHPAEFEWDPVDILSTEGDWEGELARLASKSVILIDPLSLYHTRIKDRFQLLSKSFEKEDVLFVTLAPYKAAAPYDTLRRLVRVLASPLLDPYFNPTPGTLHTAMCTVGIPDDMDLSRAIRAALLRGAAQPAALTNTYIAPPKRLRP